MDEIKDSLLQGVGVSTAEPRSVVLAHAESFPSIPEGIFRVVFSYLKLTWEIKKDDGKQIPFDEIMANTRYLFSGEGKYKDKLWVEHTATNLRELFYDLKFPKDYCRAIKNMSNDENDPENGLFGKIYKIKLYLDDIIHYRWKAASKQAQKIFEEKQLSEKSFVEIHEMICVDLFYIFYDIYKKYAFDEDI